MTVNGGCADIEPGKCGCSAARRMRNVTTNCSCQAGWRRVHQRR